MKSALLRGITCGGLIGTLALAGCGTETDDGGVEVRTGAFNTSQCAFASPVLTVAGAEYSWTSSPNYGGACNAVVDTVGSNANGGLWLPYGSEADLNSLPTTQAACETVTIRTVFYFGTAGNSHEEQSYTGVWGPMPFNRTGCSLQGTARFGQGVGVEVRVATTVRRPSASSFVTYPFTTSHHRKPR